MTRQTIVIVPCLRSVFCVVEVDLLLLLVSIAPNAVLLPLRLVEAIMSLQDESMVNYTSWSLRDFAETVGERIRIALAKVRDIKRVQAIRARCERKASPKVVAAINGILNHVRLDECIDCPLIGRSDGTVGAEAVPNPLLALPVLWETCKTITCLLL